MTRPGDGNMWLIAALALGALVLLPKLKQESKQQAVNNALDLGLDTLETPQMAIERIDKLLEPSRGVKTGQTALMEYTALDPATRDHVFNVIAAGKYDELTTLGAVLTGKYPRLSAVVRFLSGQKAPH